MLIAFALSDALRRQLARINYAASTLRIDNEDGSIGLLELAGALAATHTFA